MENTLGITWGAGRSYRIVLDGPFLGGLSFRIEDDDRAQKTVGKMLNELQVLARATILRGANRAGIDEILPKFKTTLIEILSDLYAVDRHGMRVSNHCLMRSAVGPGGRAILVRFWPGRAGPRPTTVAMRGGMRNYEDMGGDLGPGAHKSKSFCPPPRSNKKEESPRPSAPPREDEEKSPPTTDPEPPPAGAV
jgi:hypothetical protein